MPFADHPFFPPPEGGDATIWRYMDLAKFLSILDTSSLYFVRMNRLAEIDPYEGYYPTENLTFEDFDRRVFAFGREKDPNLVHEMFERDKKSRTEFMKVNQTLVFVNSWHVQAYESAAMWSQYLKSQDGIAVQSTYKNLIASIAQYEEYEINIGMVQYVDYKKEVIPMNWSLTPFMCKRKSFEHERELRCFLHLFNRRFLLQCDPELEKFKEVYGIHVPVDLKVLIGAVYLAPTSPIWVRKLLESLMRKFNLEKPVLQSDLASVPS